MYASATHHIYVEMNRQTDGQTDSGQLIPMSQPTYGSNKNSFKENVILKSIQP